MSARSGHKTAVHSLPRERQRVAPATKVLNSDHVTGIQHGAGELRDNRVVAREREGDIGERIGSGDRVLVRGRVDEPPRISPSTHHGPLLDEVERQPVLDARTGPRSADVPDRTETVLTADECKER